MFLLNKNRNDTNDTDDDSENKNLASRRALEMADLVLQYLQNTSKWTCTSKNCAERVN